jgi:hypothetical protein
MNDVNPLGPMMHLKEIERKALALRATGMKSRLRVVDTAFEWIIGSLKWLYSSLRAMSAGTSAHVGRR